MAKPHKSGWEHLTPEQKQARVDAMLKARAAGRRKRSAVPSIVRPKEIEEVRVSDKAHAQSPVDILAQLIVAVAKQITKEQS